MTRLWLTLSALAALAALAALPLAAVAGDRPNVLFIITDDQAAQDLSVYNPDTRLETPTIAALAERGITLDAAYHMGSFSGAVCAPSRTMVMTGRTVWRLPPIRSRSKPKPEVCPPDIAAKSLAAVFNRAGYDTMRTCKRGNSYAGANAQFSVVRDKTARDGTAEEGSAWHADQVLDYLEDRETRGDADPFLIYFGFSHPHDPRGGTPELLAKYGAENRDKVDDIPALNPDAPALPPNYLPAHPFPHGQPGLRDEEKVEGVYDRRDEATVRNEIGRNHACTENIDIQIDRVLKKLEATGELDNTYVFFTSDHGIAVGRHGLMGKQSLYEHSWRVPMIVAGPGITPGSRAPGFVYLADVLPTLCDLTGVPIPDTVLSTSFAPVLRGDRDKIRDVMYGVYCGGTKPGIRAVRQGDWKLVKWDVLDGRVRKTQLFNLAENPHELLPGHHVASVRAMTRYKEAPTEIDLADDPRYATKRAQLEALLTAQMDAYEDPYRLWYQAPETDL